jgi:hypothetical protein
MICWEGLSHKWGRGIGERARVVGVGRGESRPACACARKCAMKRPMLQETQDTTTGFFSDGKLCCLLLMCCSCVANVLLMRETGASGSSAALRDLRTGSCVAGLRMVLPGSRTCSTERTGATQCSPCAPQAHAGEHLLDSGALAASRAPGGGVQAP